MLCNYNKHGGGRRVDTSTYLPNKDILLYETPQIAIQTFFRYPQISSNIKYEFGYFFLILNTVVNISNY
jgi:hypothetical protein